MNIAVIPTKVGIQHWSIERHWTPAFAWVTGAS
jgi:hypothetical protein